MAVKTLKPAPVAQSAAPGAAGDPKAQKAPKTKVVRKSFIDTLEVPEGTDGPALLTHNDERIKQHDRKLHKNLTPKDFTSKSEYMRFRALFFDAVANRLRTEADKFEKLGSIVDNKKAKRLLALSGQIEALKASLAEDGQDVAALLASMGIGAG